MLKERNLAAASGPLLDSARGSLIGGAAGDALGYAVEFMTLDQIRRRYGKNGITSYELDPITGKALISDDTQMTLFTASAVIAAAAERSRTGNRVAPDAYAPAIYREWLRTQTRAFDPLSEEGGLSGLLRVPELFSRRAPGNTCLSALSEEIPELRGTEYLLDSVNDSKGCGGIMRVAPAAFGCPEEDPEAVAMECAILSAITHGHPLGYLPSAALGYLLSLIRKRGDGFSLRDAVVQSRNALRRMFRGTFYLEDLSELINLALSLSENGASDVVNIRRLGEGWVAEETLAIALYCSLRHERDFDAGVIAAVNHSGDSDSTGAVTGNILGALIGYRAISPRWTKDLELKEVILKAAEDLCFGCLEGSFGQNGVKNTEI